MRSPIVVTLLLTALVSAACDADSSRGQCVFFNAESVTKLNDPRFLPRLVVARRHTDRNRILVVTYDRMDEKESRAGVIAIDVVTGQQSADFVPYDGTGKSWPPEGYTFFESGQQPADTHELIRGGKLRFEYLGKRGSASFPHRNMDGNWSVDREERFTGTRRMMYGDRPLTEQQFVNYSRLFPISDYVQIEPDGDRLVCMCQDRRGTWVALFSKRGLDAQETKMKSDQQKRP